MARPPLTRERIIVAAAAVADRGGLGAVSMRNIGRELGVEAMSIYHHLSGKDELLDELSDWVFALIELPELGAPWRESMRTRAASARDVLHAHPWGLGLIESRRSPGPALLHHHNRVLGCLREDGFSVELATHAFVAIDAFVYGFVLTEQTVPIDRDDAASVEELAVEIATAAEHFPYFVEMISEQVVDGDFVLADEFDFGLDLILDGLEQRLAAQGAQ